LRDSFATHVFHRDTNPSFLQSPLTGRVSAFLPFLPFRPGEQAVVVHKYLLELSQKVRTSINLSAGENEQLLGNIRLRIRRDASVCRAIAEQEYHPDLGARSLLTAVKSLVEDVLVESYLEVEKGISETEKMMEFVVDVNGEQVLVDMVNDERNL
jgi:ATP-dependent Clp protease ATP-binding subunit ClpA